MVEYYRLMQKVTDYSCAILFTPRNEKYFVQFIDLVFKQIQEGVCQVASKVVGVILRQMLIQFNGMKDEMVFFITKKSVTKEQD